jgi:hypothetical protein
MRRADMSDNFTLRGASTFIQYARSDGLPLLSPRLSEREARMLAVTQRIAEKQAAML